MSNVPTVRIKSPDGFLVINADDFDPTEHELFDKKDKALLPVRPKKVAIAEAADAADLRKQLGDALNRATEAESERDEMKARAEAAEAQIATQSADKDKKGSK